MSPRRRVPAPVWIVLRCTGRQAHPWRHDDSAPYRPRYCIWCKAPFRQAAEAAAEAGGPDAEAGPAGAQGGEPASARKNGNASRR